MAELRNLTPFANMQFVNLDARGREFGIYMVKAAFDILPDGTCRLSDEQEPFEFTDAFHGGINESSVRYASDLVPYKPTTDVVLNATAFSRSGKPRDQWTCGIEIKHADTEDVWVSKRLQITGPRTWNKSWRKWRLSEAEPIASLDIRYENAYGGMFQIGKDGDGAPVLDAFERNTIGQGFVAAAKDHGDAPIPAPQILHENETLNDPFVRRDPAGFGPIPAAWLPRRPLGGTYDAHWEDNVWPNWPADYDFAFHNCASAGLSAPLNDTARLNCKLTNLHPDKPVWNIKLPDPDLVILANRDGKMTYYHPRLDTIFLDIAEDRLDDPRVFLVSRLVFEWAETDQLILMQHSKNSLNPSDIQPAPHPHDVARFEALDDQTLNEAQA